ncbi:uncharacterized protein ASCRUDRAFT_152613 [Ascoidea rubescens DSM 1968]|uniref:Uncharacterized protein n=1 Tax=Ascoidea rubescens DSM 1968 TaxID=1344418 RepID=A0A1D2VGZ1_9ASCO|nr:hypothetical protein ASCRUDRAFT_152613 [Ascoidea rubescens DSM 1968]ODV60928.1 hypothetical protein ASCRUDRAFT_152613 [Ascoidea rubescens DSM 1968]
MSIDLSNTQPLSSFAKVKPEANDDPNVANMPKEFSLKLNNLPAKSPTANDDSSNRTLVDEFETELESSENDDATINEYDSAHYSYDYEPDLKKFNNNDKNITNTGTNANEHNKEKTKTFAPVFLSSKKLLILKQRLKTQPENEPKVKTFKIEKHLQKFSTPKITNTNDIPSHLSSLNPNTHQKNTKCSNTDSNPPKKPPKFKNSINSILNPLDSSKNLETSFNQRANNPDNSDYDTISDNETDSDLDLINDSPSILIQTPLSKPPPTFFNTSSATIRTPILIDNTKINPNNNFHYNSSPISYKFINSQHISNRSPTKRRKKDIPNPSKSTKNNQKFKKNISTTDPFIEYGDQINGYRFLGKLSDPIIKSHKNPQKDHHLKKDYSSSNFYKWSYYDFSLHFNFNQSKFRESDPIQQKYSTHPSNPNDPTQKNFTTTCNPKFFDNILFKRNDFCYNYEKYCNNWDNIIIIKKVSWPIFIDSFSSTQYHDPHLAIDLLNYDSVKLFLKNGVDLILKDLDSNDSNHSNYSYSKIFKEIVKKERIRWHPDKMLRILRKNINEKLTDNAQKDNEIIDESMNDKNLSTESTLSHANNHSKTDNFGTQDQTSNLKQILLSRITKVFQIINDIYEKECI